MLRHLATAQGTKLESELSVHKEIHANVIRILYVVRILGVALGACASEATTTRAIAGAAESCWDNLAQAPA